ncbi:hypothetical protein [Pedobacter jejuensis]|uniref:Uncharacterized protein n=1 Tax=Pedobacter jejuensis TaxID=1268550 RepID=A0A3N0BQL2_9SPHI|nr:hypothetical protein [Pedobacter jejuensis]RNL50758.1 hypothetical protein D7004_17880 [Pedobacter jejuensis]
MKKLIFIALAFVLIFPNNGCRILKNKKLDKKTEDIRLQNDVQVSSLAVDSLASLSKGIYNKSNTTIKETISYKSAPEEPVELTAKFRIDTANSLKGDTALTLIDVNNNGTTLTIIRNPKTNELTAKVKTKGRTKSIPFNEMLINRTITNGQQSGDTSKSITSTSKKQKDSIGKFKSFVKKSESNLNKSKDTKPSWVIWLGITAIIGFFLWIGFKK